MPRIKRQAEQPQSEQQQPKTQSDKRSSDDILQIRDSQLKAWIERRQNESGAYSMAEVVRRAMTIGLMIDEIMHPGDEDDDEQAHRRIAKLRSTVMLLNAETTRLGQVQPPQALMQAQIRTRTPAYNLDDNDEIQNDSPDPGGNYGSL